MEKLFVYLPVGCRGFYFNEKRNYSWVHVIIYYISCCESTFLWSINLSQRKGLKIAPLLGKISMIIYCVHPAVIWGIQGIARKMGVEKIHSLLLYFLVSTISCIIGCIWSAMLQKSKILRKKESKNYIWISYDTRGVLMEVYKINSHRSKLMALCILSIMICHNTMQFTGMPQSINDAIRLFCQGGRWLLNSIGVRVLLFIS